MTTTERNNSISVYHQGSYC